MAVITIWCLIGEDLRLAIFSKNFDVSLDTVAIFCTIALFVELLMLTIVQENYFLGFYFWLDLFFVASMVCDINIFWRPLSFTEDNLQNGFDIHLPPE